MLYKLFRQVIRGGAAAGLLVMGPYVAHAQLSFPSAPADTLFQRPTLPSECLAASNRLRLDDKWTANADTLPYDPTRFMSASAMTQVRLCRARLDPAAVPRESLQMFELLLQLGEVDSALVYWDRARAGIPSDLPQEIRDAREQKIFIEASIILGRTKPTRLAAVEHFIRSAGSLAFDTVGSPFQAYSLLYEDAITASDHERMVQSFDGMVKGAKELLPRLPADHDERLRVMGRLSVAASGLAEIAWLESGPESALATARQHMSNVYGAEAASRIVDQYLVVGTRTPALPDSGMTLTADGRAKWEPLPKGKVTLLVAVPTCESANFAQCASARSVVRRLYERYGKSVAFVLVGATGEYLKDKFITDLEEARRAQSEFFFKTLGLPGQLIMVENVYTRNPDPDRRMTLVGSGELGKVLGKPGQTLPLGSMFVIDPSGTISAGHLIHPRSEQFVSYLLDGVLKKAKPILPSH